MLSNVLREMSVGWVVPVAKTPTEPTAAKESLNICKSRKVLNCVTDRAPGLPLILIPHALPEAETANSRDILVMQLLWVPASKVIPPGFGTDVQSNLVPPTPLKQTLGGIIRELPPMEIGDPMITTAPPPMPAASLRACWIPAGVKGYLIPSTLNTLGLWAKAPTVLKTTKRTSAKQAFMVLILFR